MNREKLHLLPKMQVGFVDSICIPVYEVCTCMVWGGWDRLCDVYTSLFNNHNYPQNSILQFTLPNKIKQNVLYAR